jgi:hypothetical protein
MANRPQKVSLEKIAKERLARQIVESIDTIEIAISENVEPGFLLEIGRKTIRLRFNYIGSTKKFLAWCAGITTAIAGAITVLRWLMPIIVAYFAHSPP